MTNKILLAILCMIFLVSMMANASAFLPPGTGGGDTPTIPPPTPPAGGDGTSQPTYPDVVGPIVFISASSTNIPADSQLTITASAVDNRYSDKGIASFTIKENDNTIYTKNCNNAFTCSGSVTFARSKGTYIYSVDAVDASGNHNSPASIAVVFGNRNPNAPSLVNPANNTYSTISNPALSWTKPADPDNDALTYDIEIDGVITNVNALSYSTSLADGSHTWRVRAVDTENAVSAFSETRIVKIDTTSPQLLNSNIADVELGNDALIQVDVIEANLISLKSEIDGTNYTMQQQSGNTYIYLLVSPSYGTHNVKYYALDGVGNVNSLADSFNVVDTTSPQFNPAPSDKTIELGSSFSYDIDASDLRAITYSIDDTTNFNINTAGLITNKTSLAVGSYPLQINASDLDNNNNLALIIISVVDTTKPIYNPMPSNQVSEYGQPFSYDVNANDLQSIAYSLNDTINFNINSAGLITNITSLNLGNYAVRVTATDSSENSALADINILISDTIAPTFNPSPSNQQSEYGQPFSYDVHADDLQAIVYAISDIINFAIDSVTGIITKLDNFLAIGNYVLKINATDASGNTNSTQITIAVDDNVGPTAFDLSSPISGTISKSTTPTLTWNPSSDYNFSRYVVEIDNNADFSSIDYSYILYGIANTSVQASLPSDGTFYWHVIAYDKSENSRLSNSNFSYITDNTAPTFNNLADKTIDYNENLVYDASATDLHLPISYIINDTVRFNIDSNGIITNKTSLALGQYNMQVNATDAVSNIKTGSMTLTVQPDLNPPVFNNPMINQNIEYGQSFSFDASASDPNTPITYSISDTTNFNINTSGQITNKTALLLTTYPLQINATDFFNNSNVKTISIIVQDTTQPAVFDLASPANNTASTDVSPVLTWIQSSDLLFDKYVVEIDNNADFSSIDYSYTLLGISNTSKQVTLPDDGTFYWRVNAYDTSGNSRQSTNIFVYTTDAVPPSLMSSEITGHNNYVFSPQNLDGNYDSIDITLTASEPVKWNIDIYNSTNDKVKYYSTINNVTSIQRTWDGQQSGGGYVPDGIYKINATMEDRVGNIVTTTIQNISVDNTAPAYSNINRTSDPIYTDMDITLEVTWTDSSLMNVYIEHNATGTWQNASVIQNGNNYSAIISNSMTDEGEAIGWRSYAKDSVLNDNYLMPVQTFDIKETTLAGKVNDSDNDIYNALVELEQNQILIDSTTTDENGQFSFKGIVAGAYNLTIVKEGFNLFKELINIVIGVNEKDATITPSVSSGTISGAVYENVGWTKVADAEVYIYESGTSDLVQVVDSDANGNYVINGLLTSMSYDLNATHASYPNTIFGQTGITPTAGGIDIVIG